MLQVRPKMTNDAKTILFYKRRYWKLLESVAEAINVETGSVMNQRMKKNSRDLKLQQQRAQGKDEDPRSPGQIGSIYVKNGTIRCVSTEDEEIDQLWKEKNKVRDKCQERSGL
uniref:CDKN1A interacting zinc finger protein 1 n=1 Tax=Caenorhabditis tropicalis TaxID=1561998 RepID=A0A1I7TPF7_9PELO